MYGSGDCSMFSAVFYVSFIEAYVDFTMLHNTSLADCMKFFYMYF